jgi:endonuclease/exonuclease/phosphatase family metal-dependent hydrolase
VKIVQKILFYLNLALVVLTLLAYLSPYIDPGKFWPLSFPGLIFPVLLLLNLIFIFYWMITDWKKSWLSIVFLLIGAPYILVTFSISNQSIIPKNSFTVSSYNMNYAHGTYKKGTYRYDEKRSKDFADFIMDRIDADILCGQESNQRIRSLIGKYYPYQHFLKKTGTVIYSRFPIVEKGQIDFGTVTNSCVWADIAIREDTVRVYSAHLQSNRISSDADKLLEEAEETQQVSFTGIRSILAKYKQYVGIRAYQARMLYHHMNESPYPVILTGDLNDPPVSYTHRILSKNKKDSFEEAGNGLGITYAGRIPLLRIDNVIVSEAFSVFRHEVIRERFSDHYPVKVTLGNREIRELKNDNPN